MSFFELSGVPHQFGVLLLTVGLILVLTPYLAGQDLGPIKIPNIKSRTTKKRLKILGPIAFLFFLFLFFPIWPKEIELAPDTVADGVYDVQYRDPMVAGTENTVSLAIALLPQIASIIPPSSGVFPPIDHKMDWKSEADLVRPIKLALASKRGNIEISKRMRAELIGFGRDGEPIERTVDLEPPADPTFWKWLVTAPEVATVHSFFIQIYLANDKEPRKVLAFEYEVVEASQITAPTPPNTPVPSGTPSAIAKTRLDVRSGPGDKYDLVGYLPEGATAEIVGQDETGQWWQIETNLTKAGTGWIKAGVSFSEATDTSNVPIALAPPTPKSTPPPRPTATPTSSTTPTLTHTPRPTATPTFTPIPTQAPTPPITSAGEDYTVQADDWLSKLADKFYGDVNAYWAIMSATNLANADDSSYAKIVDPNQIEVGAKLLIPSADDAVAFMADFDPASAQVEKLFASRAKGQLLVGDWWTSGGEFAGINAVYEIYRKENPDVELIHAGIAGGAGTQFKGANLNKLISGDPFDTFQLHAGKEALLYSPEEYLMPVDDVLEEAGVLDVMPEDLKNVLKIEGKTYTVPLNIHRGNVMWTNTRLLEQAGVAVPTNFEEFAAACETLKAAGIVPLAQGSTDRFEVFHTFETVLLGTLDADKALGLYDGTTSWADPGVTQALENFDLMLNCVNEDWGNLNWVGAIDLVINDQAAFNIMGDWAYGEVIFKNATDYVTWNPPPGNEGLFNMVSDGFAITKAAPNPENAAEFVRIITRKEAQEAFNQNKGSICARTDCDYSTFSFPAYFKSSASDFATNRILPSMTHGSAMHPAWQQQVSDIITQFASDRDVAKAQAALVLAAEDAGFPQQ